MHPLVENKPFIPVINSLWSQFFNRDLEPGTKGCTPLVPGQITGTKAPAQGKKNILHNPRIELKMYRLACSFFTTPPTQPT